MDIFEACITGNLERVQELIAQGVNVNSHTHSTTPLMWAASTQVEYQQNSLEIVKLLISANADINVRDIDGSTALMHACMYNNLPVLQVLIDNGAEVEATNDNGLTPLMIASNYGNLLIVKKLLSLGVSTTKKDNINEYTALRLAIKGNHLLVVQELLTDNNIRANINIDRDADNRTLLIEAASNGNLAIVKELLGAGADVNAKGGNDYSTALSFAIASPNGLEVIKELIRAGANNDRGDMLIVAIENHNSEALKYFIESNFSNVNMLNLQDTGSMETALMFAARKEILEIVKELIILGADVNLQNTDGNTALMFAAEKGNLSIVKELIKAGANVKIKNNKGKLAHSTDEEINKLLKVSPPNTKCETLVNRWLKSEIPNLQLLNTNSPTISEIDMLVVHSKGSVTRQEVIDCLKFKKIQLSPELQTNLETSMCPLCLMNKNLNIIENTHPFRVCVLPCGHTFHKECIEGNFKRETDRRLPHTCPLCRKEYNTPATPLMLGGYHNKLQKYQQKLKLIKN